MCTFKLAAVSNWGLYQGCRMDAGQEGYAKYLAGLLDPGKDMPYKPSLLIVREKNLPEEKYLQLFQMVWEQCKGFPAMLIPHTYVKAARQAGCGCIHLPFPLFVKYRKPEGIGQVGVSIHSLKEAKQAESLGATYLTAGHIFQTDCKMGVPPRGIRFLEEICENVSIPVFAIGGVKPGNLHQVQGAKAAGACMMSEYMERR